MIAHTHYQMVTNPGIGLIPDLLPKHEGQATPNYSVVSWRVWKGPLFLKTKPPTPTWLWACVVINLCSKLLRHYIAAQTPSGLQSVKNHSSLASAVVQCQIVPTQIIHYSYVVSLCTKLNLKYLPFYTMQISTRPVFHMSESSPLPKEGGDSAG